MRLGLSHLADHKFRQFSRLLKLYLYLWSGDRNNVNVDVILIPCKYQVIVLVCNILVYFLFLQSIYVSLHNVYLSNL